MIMCEYAGIEKSYLVVGVNTNVDYSTMSAHAAILEAQRMDTDYLTGFLATMWAQTNISMNVKAEIAISVMNETGNSLQAANKAGRLLAKEVGKELNPSFNFQPIISAWRSRTNAIPTGSKTIEKK